MRESVGLLMNTGSPTNLPRMPTPPQLSNGPLTPLSKRNFSVPHTSTSTPTFTSLSSQPNSPSGYEYVIPDSPPFGSLVEEAIKVSKPIHSEAASYDDVMFHKSEGSSQESVLNQLTQGIDEEDSNMPPEPRSMNGNMTIDIPSPVKSNPQSIAGLQAAAHSPVESQRSDRAPQGISGLPLQSQTPLRIRTPQANLIHVQSSSPTYLYSPIHPIGTSATRQSWYQAQPRRRSSKKMSGSEIQASRVQSPARSDTNVASPTSIGPKPVAAFIASPSQPTSQIDQSTSQTQDSWTQSEHQMPTSYPPLQTQAPYRSQSMSQD